MFNSTIVSASFNVSNNISMFFNFNVTSIGLLLIVPQHHDSHFLFASAQPRSEIPNLSHLYLLLPNPEPDQCSQPGVQVPQKVSIHVQPCGLQLQTALLQLPGALTPHVRGSRVMGPHGLPGCPTGDLPQLLHAPHDGPVPGHRGPLHS